MTTLPPTPTRPVDDPDARAEAARLLRGGALVAFPTETVYGLGADATNEDAVARIFAAKDRPRFNPLISHVPTSDAAFALGQATAGAERLAAAHWPGPLTMVLQRHPGCPIAWLTSAGLETVALRVPGSAAARSLLAEADRPIAAPSANRSGRVSPTTAAHVAEELDGRAALILDGGPCPVGLESTVIDLSGDRPRLLRPGAVTREQIEALLGPVELAVEGDAITAPGMLASHYAPNASVRLDATERRPGEAFLDFGATVSDADADLSPSRDLLAAAAKLFAALRVLDRPGVATIAVAPIPTEGLGAAINDRLRRAAAPRS
ncbi:L-threonylcarbamoyladenylate synthase [Thalassobaculum sp.]|uniref:L-threonylcarbamoyladenylate synthase n=1 Tax=Thalassobaculum sp. TaxID=2022740 RepID=UPI0032EDC027